MHSMEGLSLSKDTYDPRIWDENLLILCKTVWRKAFHGLGWDCKDED